MADFNPCPNRETNNAVCTCPSTNCERHGICCQCVARHLGMGNLPQCYVQKGLKLEG